MPLKYRPEKQVLVITQSLVRTGGCIVAGMLIGEKKFLTRCTLPVQDLPALFQILTNEEHQSRVRNDKTYPLNLYLRTRNMGVVRLTTAPGTLCPVFRAEPHRKAVLVPAGH
jgi:hypothetical protein